MTATQIVEKFGGPAALARLLNKGQSTIAYWQKVGTIPAKWQPVLMDLASRQGVGLSAADFVPMVQEDLKPAEPEASGIPRATHFGDLPIGDALFPRMSSIMARGFSA